MSAAKKKAIATHPRRNQPMAGERLGAYWFHVRADGTELRSFNPPPELPVTKVLVIALDDDTVTEVVTKHNFVAREWYEPRKFIKRFRQTIPLGSGWRPVKDYGHMTDWQRVRPRKRVASKAAPVTR